MLSSRLHLLTTSILHVLKMAYSLHTSSSTLIPISATSSAPEIPTNTTAPTSLGTTASTTNTTAPTSLGTTASTTSACNTPASDMWNYFKESKGSLKQNAPSVAMCMLIKVGQLTLETTCLPSIQACTKLLMTKPSVS